jgi:hypothetical protein
VDLFRPEDFIEPLCIGELRFALERVTKQANRLLRERADLAAQILEEVHLEIPAHHKNVIPLRRLRQK